MKFTKRCIFGDSCDFLKNIHFVESELDRFEFRRGFICRMIQRFSFPHSRVGFPFGFYANDDRLCAHVATDPRQNLLKFRRLLVATRRQAHASYIACDACDQ